MWIRERFLKDILKDIRILVVDDEEILAWSIETELKSHGAEVHTANSLKAGIETFSRINPDLAVCDIRLPDGSGMELLKKWRHEKIDIPIILITAHGAIESAIDALRLGAFDYLQKPFDMKSLVAAVKRAAELSQLRQKVSRLTGLESSRAPLKIVGSSEAMNQVKKRLTKIAQSKSNTALILGESGTGKELAAQAVHEWSAAANQPFVEINCASIPENLLESELFGYEKGAFTDARDRKLGLFEMAQSGTIFLDEIGEMPISLQSKLLRVLESRRFKRLGATRDIQFNARVVAATNRDLLSEIKNQRFRADLFYRISSLPVTLPPLRERPDDLDELCDFFISKLADELGCPRPTLSREASQKLARHDWPGNVRELKNVLERVMVFDEPQTIEAAHIQFDMPLETNRIHERLNGHGPEPVAPMASAAGNGHLPPTAAEPGMFSQPAYDGFASAHNGHSSWGSLHHDADGAGTWRLPEDGINLEGLEKSLLMQALEKTRNNQTKAAALLGISRHTFRYRLEKYGILNH
jgi:DNA-binding NtrC family response regulator